MTVVVVAIQGDFEKHAEAIERIGNLTHAVREVRILEDLKGVDRVIIPGGESTTVGLLMKRFGLGEALVNLAKEGMPIWGTCMGMILMAKSIEGLPHQFSLGLLDIEVRRNAFGAQVHSFEGSVKVQGLDEPVTGVFIRAPVVSRLGEGVQKLSEYDGRVVAVRQGNLVGTSFHPELTPDTRFHEWFLGI